VGRDTSNDRGGDQAVWRDLVARLELPQAIDPADAPWPDRENLTPTPRPGRAGPEAQAAGRREQAGREADSQDPDDSPRNGQEQSDTGPEADEPVSRRRVIRPATFLRFAEASQHGEAGPGEPEQSHAKPGPGRHRRDGGGLGHGLDFQDLADLEFSDEDDERYVPPDIPPQPKLDPVARGAWAALFGGPGYLFLATTLSWQVPGWAELAAIIAFITGFVVLVSRLGDGPSRKDGPDQGAVV
jgi:hypothetical protein